MDKLINFSLNLMEKENKSFWDPSLLPSQNQVLNPFFNKEINTSQNRIINSSQNRLINPSQNSNWKGEQWNLFKKLIIWDYLSENQRDKCKKFLMDC